MERVAKDFSFLRLAVITIAKHQSFPIKRERERERERGGENEEPLSDCTA